MKRLLSAGFVLSALVVLVSPPACAATKKAVLIGINCYNPDSAGCGALRSTPATQRVRRDGVTDNKWNYWRYRNLEGTINDVELMRSILAFHGFEIPPDAVLLDAQASADAILFTLQKYLLDDARAGDIRVVYYSGHGNQVLNTATNEPDETIVPADHWRGTPDVRDKELSRILWKAGRAGVKVIFIADSCHSGSLTRGAEDRWAKTADSGSIYSSDAPRVADRVSRIDKNGNPIDPANQDAYAQGKDIDPAAVGVLFLSAARRDQLAEETNARSDDINDPSSGMHGAFTWALKLALEGDHFSDPIDQVFQRASVFLSALKPSQVPNLEGRDRTLVDIFYETANGASAQRVVASVGAAAAVVVKGASPTGLYPGTELKRVSPASPEVRLRVTKPVSLAASEAKQIAGPPLRQGDVFEAEVDKWVVPTGSTLNVYIPPPVPARVVFQAAARIGPLASDPSIHWIDDESADHPSPTDPTYRVHWNGAGWFLEKVPGDGSETNLGSEPGAADIKKYLPAGARLILQLPPTAELSQELPFGKADNQRVALMKTPAGATYSLHGRMHEGQVEYAWVLRDSSAAQMSGALSRMPLPVHTQWTPVTDDRAAVSRAAAVMADLAHRLGRLREWQMLEPPGKSRSEFPYHLVFREAGSGREISTGTVTGGQNYKLYLRADESVLRKLPTVKPCYVYIFVVDQFGKSTLLHPVLGRGNQDNLFPLPPAPGVPAPNPRALIPVTDQESDFEISEPYGIDTYLLLASEQRLDNPDVLQFDGVRTRGAAGPMNALTELLSEIGAPTRGPRPDQAIPSDWTLERRYLASVPAK